jgi:LacI family transcriptional regulator/LacI family repressor for deo operon, udp, cdd, tsx, nupC, and nupG
MATTIKDIARQAGVSHTTVSRALHNSPLISEETTQRIQAIAAELNYHPSFVARSLKTNRTQALGVIVSHIDDPFFSEILQGIDDVAQANGYSLFIAASQHDFGREKAIIQTMREHRVDGVILCSPRYAREQGHPLYLSDIPLVAINNQAMDDYPFSIYHDDVDGARQACEHLIGLGHRQIGFLGDATSGRTTQERLAGFQQTMQSADLESPSEYINLVPGSSALQGYEAVRYFLSLEHRPTALICYNDMMAVGVLKGLHQAGLRVPEDISVTGFDNITVSEYTAPPLTTIDQPKRFLGAEAARMMLDQLNNQPGLGDNHPIVKRLKGTLLIRGSTSPMVSN